MSPHTPIFDRVLAPIFQNFLIDRQALVQYRNSKDWQRESDRFCQPGIVYPEYYRSQSFHGISGGYLTVDAAVTYDAITRYVLPPNEDWVRQGLVDRVRCQPRRILDLGCGTGSTTLSLKQAFPAADVTGIDLSPYMLVVAEEKAQAAGLSIQFHQGQAEQTGLAAASFDLVTVALLCHELPIAISSAVLQEAFRLLEPGGEVLVLDGNQAALRQATWLTEIFAEPYIKAYAAGSLDAWMGAAGFIDVQTEDLWWVQQVTRGVKPLPYSALEWEGEAMASLSIA